MWFLKKKLPGIDFAQFMTSTSSLSATFMIEDIIERCVSGTLLLCPEFRAGGSILSRYSTRGWMLCGCSSTRVVTTSTTSFLIWTKMFTELSTCDYIKRHDTEYSSFFISYGIGYTLIWIINECYLKSWLPSVYSWSYRLKLFAFIWSTRSTRTFAYSVNNTT